MVQTQEPIVLDDEAWERVVRITKGAAAPCYQCGVCTAVCPWGLVRDEPLSVRKLIRRAQLDVGDSGDDLWLCTTCAACVVRCPRGVDIPGVMLALREAAWRKRTVPEGFPSMLWSEYWNGNPWERPPSDRPGWMRGLDLPRYSAEHEILLYAGCSACYDRRIQKVARALVSVLQGAGVSFGVLADDEPCCGDAVRSVGHTDYAQMIVDESSRRFAELGVKTIVTVSPHCYDMFKNHYQVGNGFRPLHYSQYLAELVAAGRLAPANELSTTATFHDPCFLARHNDECEAPRKVLAAIPGLKTVEMAHSGEDTLCCGGGGGRMWLETPPGERFSDLRVKEAVDVGADVVVTACPHCISCLEDSLAGAGVEGMRVLDLAEVVALAATNGSGPAAKSKRKSRKKRPAS